MRHVVQVVEPQQSSQQHKQLQAPMQQQQQQPQATPQQHEEELVDTTDAVMERQHRTAQQYQGPNPNNMNWYSMDRTHPTKRRKGERPAERAQATSEEQQQAAPAEQQRQVALEQAAPANQGAPGMCLCCNFAMCTDGSLSCPIHQCTNSGHSSSN